MIKDVNYKIVQMFRKTCQLLKLIQEEHMKKDPKFAIQLKNGLMY